MSYRKKVKVDNSDNTAVRFSNWLAQICSMLLTKSFYMIAGRGSAKTTEFQAERLIEMAYDMPGAPVVWVADTYTNLKKNILPTLQEALESKGYREGIHYVIDKKPDEFTEAEKAELDPTLRKHFWQPHNKISSYKNTLIFFTGLNITFGSLDKPASLAGRSYVHVFGDEVKYFKEAKIGNLMKAVRGYYAKYGHSVFYRGHTFTTDMPNTAHIGEYDWILNFRNRMDVKGIMLALRTALVLNDALQEYLAAKDAGDRIEATKKKRVYERWKERWMSVRMHKSAQVFFYIASSYVNVDILTPEYFEEASADELGDFKTAILSMMATLESGQRFYANLTERHFYMDGINQSIAENDGLKDLDDCRMLKYHNINRSMDIGVDFGNMMSMSIAQESGKYYRVTKFIYTLSPQFISHLAKEFRRFYAPQKEKTVQMYYDRAGNNYKKAGKDLASQLKREIEFDDSSGTPVKTGWKVILMSEKQGNIGINEEWVFMNELLSGNNRNLPKVLIDFWNCKELRLSLQNTPAKKNAKEEMVKDKSSEKLPINRLPLESSNASDSWKYLMMRKTWRRLIRARKSFDVGDAGVR
nr:hypothetical protein [uncultured Pedobacter sp.]